ncbi:MAG: hypothetical protein GX557_15375 [Chloroflexi bacterium]|nr:hypothetical protein [Chloroflexota bacterium]
MWKRLFTVDGLNWWLLGGGFGISFVAVGLAAVLGGYLGTLAPELYLQWGAVLNVLMVFLLCGLAGFLTARFADAHPMKHALWASLGAVIPLLVGAVLLVNPFLIMLALVSVAGALNGGRLALPRAHYSPRP